jgi:hypothetical protein
MMKRTIKTAQSKMLIKLWVDRFNEGRILVRTTGLHEKWSEGMKFTAEGLSECSLYRFMRTVDEMTGLDGTSVLDRMCSENVNQHS